MKKHFKPQKDPLLEVYEPVGPTKEFLDWKNKK
jgi:hypothetical protein